MRHAKGLSPQVRGSPGDRRGEQVGHGSIPAGAGEPIPHRFFGRLLWVYPRRCGGARTRWFARYPPRSIPAGAGKPMQSLVRLDCQGLSPQVRGSRVMSKSIKCARVEVYPRRCGGAGISSDRVCPEKIKGLSPQVRGSLALVSPSELPGALSPQVRGSLCLLLPVGREMRGLSPQVRGSPLGDAP